MDQCGRDLDSILQHGADEDLKRFVLTRLNTPALADAAGPVRQMPFEGKPQETRNFSGSAKLIRSKSGRNLSIIR